MSKNINNFNKENLYNSKVLMHNWFEDRSNPNNDNHYVKKTKCDENGLKYTYFVKEEFNKTNINYLNFQKNKIYKSSTQDQFKDPILNNLEEKSKKIKENLKKEKQNLEYIQKWTKKKGLFETSYNN